MSANKSIFFDLEIPLEDMATDPKLFAEEVFTAAAELGDILDHNSSNGTARATAREIAKKNHEAKGQMLDIMERKFSSILDDAESMPMDQLHYMIDEMKDLTRQVELTFESRATTEMIRESPSAVDKRLAMEQYKKLRDAWEAYRSFAQLMFDEKLAPLKARSGNYGSVNGRSTYPAYKLDGQVYHNYRAVGRLINCPVELRTHMDLQDYLNSTDNTAVEVVEISL